MNVDDLTINGLGFAAARPLKKRKYDLTNCIRELLKHGVIELGRGQTDAKDLFFKRSKGVYVVCFHEGEYFRRPTPERVSTPKNAILDDPLYEPLRKIGVDGPGIQRLLKNHGRGLVQRWLRITDAAMHEKPRGFAGFKVSPAAFLIDGVRHNRTPPDWMHAHEKKREHDRWSIQREASMPDEDALRRRYDAERKAALTEFLASEDGQAKYEAVHSAYLAFYQATDPRRCVESAQRATIERIDRFDFRFPEFDVWALTHRHVVKIAETAVER